MKSLETVIKQKCKFIGNKRKPYELYNLRSYFYSSTDIRLFLTNMTIESDNIITLLEEMTPLLVYIFSCICYCNEGGLEFREMLIKLKFPNAISTFGDYLNLGRYYYKTPISIIQDNIDELEASGHCMSFLAPFRLEITLERSQVMLEHEHELNDYPSDLEDEEDDDIKTINEIKTYKTDECVICLEDKNNVLFCNCGHICVCKKCIEIKRLTKCPVCKTENTILRIIE